MGMWRKPHQLGRCVGGARVECERGCDEDFARIYARALEVQKKAAAKLVSRPGTDKITMRRQEHQRDPRSDTK